MSAPNFRAHGNISPAVFVTVYASADNTVAQSSSGDQPIGISTPSQKYAPVPGNTNVYAAEDGDSITIFGLGDICNLTAGSGGFTRGQKLKPEASTGYGLPATTGALFGAIALESTSYLQLGRVQIVLGTV